MDHKEIVPGVHRYDNDKQENILLLLSLFCPFSWQVILFPAWSSLLHLRRGNCPHECPPVCLEWNWNGNYHRKRRQLFIFPSLFCPSFRKLFLREQHFAKLFFISTRVDNLLRLMIIRHGDRRKKVIQCFSGMGRNGGSERFRRVRCRRLDCGAREVSAEENNNPVI